MSYWAVWITTNCTPRFERMKLILSRSGVHLIHVCERLRTTKGKCKKNEIHLRFEFSADPGDKEYPTNRPVYVIWALGKLDENKEPTFHGIYPKSDLKLELARQEPENTCMDFTENNAKLM